MAGFVARSIAGLACVAATAGWTASPPLVDCRTNVEAAVASLQPLPAADRLEPFDATVDSTCLLSGAYEIGRAELLGQAGQWYPAEALLGKVAVDSPDFARATRRRFLIVITTRPPLGDDIELARNIAQAHAAQLPDDFRTALMAAIVAYRDGDLPTALKHFDVAKSRVPPADQAEFDRFAMGLTGALYWQERFDEVVGVIRRQQGDVDFWRQPNAVMYGVNALVRTGHVAEAQVLFDRLLLEIPDVTMLHEFAQTRDLLAAARGRASAPETRP